MSRTPQTWIGASKPIDFGGPVDRTYTPSPPHVERRTFLDILERTAARVPDRLAIKNESWALTYRELLHRVYALAARIQAETAADDVVCPMIRDSILSTLAALACLAAGRLCAPVDQSQPADRQGVILAESLPAVLILDAAAAVDETLAPPGARRLLVDRADPDATERPAGLDPAPDAPAMVIFTSGSSGRPKGVVYSNGAILTNLLAQVDASHMREDDVVLGVGVTGGSQMLAAFGAGALLRIVDVRTAGLDGMFRTMRDEGATVFTFVPAMLRMAMQMPGAAEAFASLRVLNLFGERLGVDDVALFRKVLPPGCLIANIFGSSEASFVSRWFVREEAIESGNVPVGHIAPHTEITFLTEDGAPAAPGEMGEMVVRSRYMALGLWKGGRVVQGPFGVDEDDPTKRTYALGDIGRMRADGLLEHHGRRDRMVKIRGLRADLGEVEQALRLSPQVADAVAVLERREDGLDQIVAFVQLCEGAEAPAPSVLRELVEWETAPQMVPGRFHFIAAIPRLANHKPDLVRLPREAELAAAQS